MNRTFLRGAVIVLIAALVFTACSSASKETVLTEKDFQYALTEDGSGAKLLGYNGDRSKLKGRVIIPETVEGFPVVALGDVDLFNSSFPDGNVIVGYFSGLSDVRMPTDENQIAFPAGKFTSIAIPDTVTFIGAQAFEGCLSLKSITFPKSLKAIGRSAFYESGLESVTIPDGVMIMPIAFSRCLSLTTVTLGENTQIISKALEGSYSEEGTFERNPELATVNIPPSAKFMVARRPTVNRNGEIMENTDNMAFYSCPKLNIAAQQVIKDAGYTGRF